MRTGIVQIDIYDSSTQNNGIYSSFGSTASLWRIRVLFSTSAPACFFHLQASLHAIVAAIFTPQNLLIDLTRKLVARKLARYYFHIYRNLLATRRGEHISKASSVHQTSRASVLVKLPVTKEYIRCEDY